MDKKVETKSFGAREKSWTRKEKRKKKNTRQLSSHLPLFPTNQSQPFFVLRRGRRYKSGRRERLLFCFSSFPFSPKFGKIRSDRKKTGLEGEGERERKKEGANIENWHGRRRRGRRGMGERKKKAFFMPRDLERKVPPWDLPTDPLFSQSHKITLLLVLFPPLFRRRAGRPPRSFGKCQILSHISREKSGASPPPPIQVWLISFGDKNPPRSFPPFCWQEKKGAHSQLFSFHADMETFFCPGASVRLL